MSAWLWRVDAMLYRRGLGPVLYGIGLALQLCGLVVLAVLVMMATSGEASATIINGVNGASIEYVTGGARIADGSGVSFQGRTWDIPSPRTVRATDTTGPARIGGNTINLNAARTMTPTAIGRASALALKALPVVATGVALWELWDAVRTGPDGAGGLKHDTGAEPVETEVTQYRMSGYTDPKEWRNSVSAAGDYWASETTGTSPTVQHCISGGSDYYNTVTYSYVSDSSTTGHLHWTTFGGSGCSTLGQDGSVQGFSTRVVEDSGCPASVDPLNPAYSVPAGNPVGSDGKCRRARYYWSPISPEDAAGDLEANAPPDGASLKDMAEDAVARGQGIEASDRTVGGPGSVVGTPTSTTTTNPDATTTTTTKTQTTNYYYSGDTVNYTTTTVTVVNNAGDVTTTTTTEGEPPDADQCKKHPDSLGCMKPGELPTDKPVWDTRDVVFTPEDLGFGAGSCPASNTWELSSVTLTWGYEPICEVAPMIRVAMLLMASIGAIGIVFKETSA